MQCVSVIYWTYNITGTPLSWIFYETNDLGFKLTKYFNFTSHFVTICCKALEALGFVIRLSRGFQFQKSIKAPYCSLVCPILEYGSVIGDPYNSGDSNQLKRMQRKFLKFTVYSLRIPYVEYDSSVVNQLNLPSLANHCHYANLKFIKGLLSGTIDSTTLLSLISFKVSFHILASPIIFHWSNL